MPTAYAVLKLCSLTFDDACAKTCDLPLLKGYARMREECTRITKK